MQKDPEGLSYIQVSDILKKIAHFHAVSLAYNQKRSHQWKKLECLYEILLSRPDYVEMAEKNLDFLIQTLNSDEAEKVAALKSKWVKVQKEILSYENGSNLFLTHGDLWLNNVMFNQQGMGKILDWQVLCTKHPVLDVALILCSSLTPSNMDLHAKQLIAVYIDKFRDSCLRLGAKMDNLDEFTHENFYDLFMKQVSETNIKLDRCS